MEKKKTADNEVKLKYDLELNDSFENIFASDFWMQDYIDPSMFSMVTDPVKFTATASILVRTGHCRAIINLREYDIQAPAVVNVRQSQILHVLETDKDFTASCVIMSKRFTDNLFLILKDSRNYLEAVRSPVTLLDTALLAEFEEQYALMRRIANMNSKYLYQIQVLGMSSFFLRICERCYPVGKDTKPNAALKLHQNFLNMVERDFKSHRDLDHYADALAVTTKHLSRTVKSVTGFSAVEWIDRYVVLEAKVLLKSSNLSIQQISDSLGFQTQSLFGKYFKKRLGMSPKDFRNT